MQFNLRAGPTVVINPGSVGNPRDGDPRAAYAVIDGNKVELKRIEYPIEQTIARLDASSLPSRAKEMLRESYRMGRLARPFRGPDPGESADSGPEAEPEPEVEAEPDPGE